MFQTPRTIFLLQTKGVLCHKESKRVLLLWAAEKLIATLQQLLPANFDQSVFLRLDDTDTVLVHAQLTDLTVSFLEVCKNSDYEVYAFNPDIGYLIEVHHLTKQITVGVVEQKNAV